MPDWNELYQSLEIYSRDDTKYAPAPTEDDFERFSAEFGIELPASYRAFISVFGPGELGQIFRIQSPYCVVSSWDIAKQYSALKAADVIEKYYEDSAQFRRLIPCVSSFYTAHAFSWDPGDVSDAQNHEYAIYLMRDGQLPKYFEKVADTFGDFITTFCLGPRYRNFFPDEDFEDAPDKTYKPLYWRGKKKPKGKKK